MINCTVLMGRLTEAPELKTTNSGVAVTSFSIAVERNYAPKGQERETDFIRITAWRQTAEFVCKYFTKGSMIAVQGSIQTRNYEDRNGNKRTAFEVVADNVSFCGSKAETKDAVPAEPPAQAARPSVSVSAEDDYTVLPAGDFDDDDLPF